MSENLKDRTPIGELYNLNKVNTDDLAERLWYEYFLPVGVIDGKSRAFIMEQYNVLAKMRNAVAKNTAIIITPSTRWQPETEEFLSPGSNKKIYVDVSVPELAAHPKVIIPGTPRKQKQSPKPVVNTTAPAATTGKTKHEIIIELYLAGKSKDEIMAETGYPKKLLTDCIWRHNNKK